MAVVIASNLRKEFSGDNWHTTWAADGNQYVLQCDGRGYNTRMWRLLGVQHPDTLSARH